MLMFSEWVRFHYLGYRFLWRVHGWPHSQPTFTNPQEMKWQGLLPSCCLPAVAAGTASRRAPPRTGERGKALRVQLKYGQTRND